jgi:hypothetical protein
VVARRDSIFRTVRVIRRLGMDETSARQYRARRGRARRFFAASEAAPAVFGCDVGRAALLLCLAMGREAIRTVWSSWQAFQESASDQRKLEDLAARAEKEKDAGTLAFVALSTTDPKRAAALTERAVALDPQLVWIYAARDHRPSSDPASAEWLARLQAADPDNSVPYLLEAYALAGPRVEKLYDHGTPNDAEFEAVQHELKWMALMERAFGAPKYDGYFKKHDQLTRRLLNRERNLSTILVSKGLSSHAIPSLLSLRIFAELKIHEAQKARAAGNLQRAEDLLGEVDAFGMRMEDGGETQIEKLIGLSLSYGAAKELAILYSKSGKTEDARKVSLRVAQFDKSFQAFRAFQDQANSGRWQDFRRAALLVQVFGILSLIAGFAALIGILLLELWPRRFRNVKTIGRRAACWIADHAPAILLGASTAFFISFLPFQHVLTEYRSSNYLPGEQRHLQDALGGLIEVPDYVMGVNFRFSIWAFVTIALAAVALLIVVRGAKRTKRTASNPA